MATFNITNKAEEISGYVFQITQQSPKKMRCDIVIELRKLSMTIMEYIIRANDEIDIRNPDSITESSLKRRSMFQHEASVDLHILDSMSEVAMKANGITKKQFVNLTGKTADLQDMIRKWKESDDKRFKNI